jgi:hypothetical protein
LQRMHFVRNSWSSAKNCLKSKKVKREYPKAAWKIHMSFLKGWRTFRSIARYHRKMC